MHQRSILRTCVRAYATKSKTPNLKMKPQVPIMEERLSDGSMFIRRQAPMSTADQAHAPLLRPPHEKKRHLTPADIEAMKTLRAEDPAMWTQKKLAEKFQCSEMFVSIAAPLPKSARLAKADADAAKATAATHGFRRQTMTKDRQRRRTQW